MKTMLALALVVACFAGIAHYVDAFIVMEPWDYYAEVNRLALEHPGIDLAPICQEAGRDQWITCYELKRLYSAIEAHDHEACEARFRQIVSHRPPARTRRPGIYYSLSTAAVADRPSEP